MRLNKILLCSFSILFTTFYFGFAQQNPVKRPILTWDFFKNDKPLGAKGDMMVNSGIDFKYKPVKATSTKYKLISVINIKLDTTTSYLDFTKKFKDTVLLHHHQGLIDIATIYANKLKDTIGTFLVTPTDYHLKAKNVYDRIGELTFEKQKKYLLETKFGADTAMQKKWDLYFKRTLGFK